MSKYMFTVFNCSDGTCRVRKTNAIQDVKQDGKEVVIRFTGRLTPLRVKGTMNDLFKNIKCTLGDK